MTQQINLIDRSLRAGVSWLSGVSLAAVLLFGCILVFSDWLYERYLVQQLLLANQNLELETQTTQVHEQELTEQIAVLQSKVAQHDKWRSTAQALFNQPKKCRQRLQTLIATLPNSVWLTQVEFSTGQNLRIIGASIHTTDVAAYVQALSSDTSFSGLPVHIWSLQQREFKLLSAAPNKVADEGGEQVPRTVMGYAFELSTLTDDDSKAGDLS